MPVRLDYTNTLRIEVGDEGLAPAEIKGALRRAGKAVSALRRRYDGGRLGFAGLPFDDGPARDARAFARSMRGKVDDVVVLGVGGSTLGTRAVHAALNGEYYNVFEGARAGRPRLFVLDNVDPEPVAEVLANVDPGRTLVNVVTKSGSTADTLAALLAVEGAMRGRLGKSARKRIVVTTDAEKGDLRRIAEEEGYTAFDVPSNVSGRFSVLTPVGLVPLALVGVDVRRLLAGAAAAVDRFWSDEPGANPAALSAAIEFLLDTKRGKDIQVVFPYASCLAGLASWYCRLWAESLGKAVNRKGEVVNVGQTPVVALGTSDQHSQLQLYVEGPADKAFSFWVVEEFRRTVALPRRWEGHDATRYLGGKSLNGLIAAEQRAVERALTEVGRPSVTYRIPRLDEEHVGELIALFELQTAVAAELYDVNAYDQPGAEAGKRATYALMGRDGYEELAGEIEAEERETKRAVV